MAERKFQGKEKLSLPNVKVRGTAASNDLVEAFTENWDHVKQSYNSKSDEEKEELMDFFNTTIENLGSILFGDDTDAVEL